jgi:hypothetical protein
MDAPMVVLVDVLIDEFNEFAHGVTSIYVSGFRFEMTGKRFVIPILPRCPLRTHGQLDGPDARHRHYRTPSLDQNAPCQEDHTFSAHPPGANDQKPVMVAQDGYANDFAGKHINHCCQIDKLPAIAEIGNIGTPHLIGADNALLA